MRPPRRERRRGGEGEGGEEKRGDKGEVEENWDERGREEGKQREEGVIEKGGSGG